MIEIFLKNINIPTYLQIQLEVLRLVKEGVLNDGDKLPSVRELSEHLSVNPNTVSKAYHELSLRKAVESLRGRGVFVTREAINVVLSIPQNPKPESNRSKRQTVEPIKSGSLYLEDPVRWSKYVLANPDKFLILDTETTGLSGSDEIIQIAAIDMNGIPLINELIQPLEASIHPRAFEVHRISKSMIEGKPTFKDLSSVLERATRERDIIAYNSSFDERMVRQSHAISGGYLPPGEWLCAMKAYSRFVGEKSERGGYRYQKLTGGDHSALGDCMATLEVIKVMAK